MRVFVLSSAGSWGGGSITPRATPNHLVLRLREAASKDAPGGANEATNWTILRDAAPRAALRMRSVGFGDIPKLHLGGYNGSEMAQQAIEIAQNGLDDPVGSVGSDERTHFRHPPLKGKADPRQVPLSRHRSRGSSAETTDRRCRASGGRRLAIPRRPRPSGSH